MLTTYATLSAADLKTSTMFATHMVLQQGKPVPVWGEATPGTEVSIEFAGQKKTVKADANGKWNAILDPMKVSASPRSMVITSSDGGKIKFDDVLVGEVWICSGQSNMSLAITPDLKPLCPDAKQRPIRTFQVKRFVSFKPLENCHGEWTTSPSGSAVAFGFSYFLQKALDVPVGVILTCWGSSSIEGWMPSDLADKLPKFKKLMASLENRDRPRIEKILATANDTPQGVKKLPSKDNIFLRTRANILYNAMMKPIAPYAVRGMVWYQGEANSKSADDMLQYKDNLRLWLARLRKEWNDDFYFIAVMLPRFGRVPGRDKNIENPDTLSWAWIRESQMKGLDFPNGKKESVINTIDLGSVKSIHPKDKRPVGERLALLAEKNVYGKDVAAFGPVFDRFEIDGNKLILKFKYAKGLKTKDGEQPREFWLATEKGNWKPATAKIKGDTIVLEADGIEKPVACRYAFSACPSPNLVNEAGLPAYPFRTDDWTPPTARKKKRTR